MADAIMLSPETYDRLKKLLDDWDNGFEKTLKLGRGMEVEERGTGYVKFGIDPRSSNVFSISVTDGTNTVANVTKVGFMGTLFSVTAGSPTGVANVTLHTTTCN